MIDWLAVADSCDDSVSLNETEPDLDRGDIIGELVPDGLFDALFDGVLDLDAVEDRRDDCRAA